ncbi:MAG: cupin domain-containing protein [Pseudomonadota bacterium]
MKINADFSKPALVKFSDSAWVPSPMPGVERRMLDRIGEEVARATTIVRFAPGSAFSAHTHDGGEEYLVLEGTFQDEEGDFPVGSYVRNPPTSRHTPSAKDGATILVKLHQFDPDDRTQIHVPSDGLDWDKQSDGGRKLPLHQDDNETVWLQEFAARTTVEIDAPDGLEVFVISGQIVQDTETLDRWDWLRLPTGSQFNGVAGDEGARLWIKSGHLASLPKTPA